MTNPPRDLADAQQQLELKDKQVDILADALEISKGNTAHLSSVLAQVKAAAEKAASVTWRDTKSKTATEAEGMNSLADQILNILNVPFPDVDHNTLPSQLQTALGVKL